MVGAVRAHRARSLERVVFAVHGDEAERAFSGGRRDRERCPPWSRPTASRAPTRPGRWRRRSPPACARAAWTRWSCRWPTAARARWTRCWPRWRASCARPRSATRSATRCWPRSRCWPMARTAFVECAQASGLGLVPEDDRNPIAASTRGTGELIVGRVRGGGPDRGGRRGRIGHHRRRRGRRVGPDRGGCAAEDRRGVRRADGVRGRAAGCSRPRRGPRPRRSRSWRSACASWPRPRPRTRAGLP